MQTQDNTRRFQSVNANCSGQAMIAAGQQPCKPSKTDFRDKKKRREKCIKWESMKRQIAKPDCAGK